MPNFTDSHVGYAEREALRKDDSWQAFDEVMGLAKSQDVDMVLLAGDLFHDNKPSRKAMYQVMRSLRMNCFGDKPCELEWLSDAADVFDKSFDHVNYEDPDINVAIPVFSIHGNHDDPNGEGNFCSLDLLQVSGLINYFGRTPESDKLEIKPILLQKGQTKLALYGMSNVRDERLFRTFRDNKVKFWQPGVQKQDWFNLMAVHQNHHAHNETGYLPERFLPEWLDLVVWGHEHECLIDPVLNPETMFHVMQPGSSIATSLVPGEAVPKHVAIVTVTGKEFTTENIRLKTVRPFLTREIILSDDTRFQGLARAKDSKARLTAKLVEVVDTLIEEAKSDWLAIQDDDDPPDEVPLPLIRLKVEYSAPDGGKFDCENPQRFSNRFVGKVANVKDVVQFYKKKTTTKKDKSERDMPTVEALAALASEGVKVEQLVREYVAAQSLKILPKAPFGDAVTQFVDKDDKHALEQFVNDSLAAQLKGMLAAEAGVDDEPALHAVMDRLRDQQEALFAAGTLKLKKKNAKLKPRPETWDTDMDGDWEDEPGAWEFIEGDDAEDAAGKRGAGSDDNASIASAAVTAKSTGRKAPAKKAPAKPRAPAKPKVMVDSVPAKSLPKRAVATRGRQTQLTFTQPSQAQELSDDEISDDDAFDPAPVSSSRRRFAICLCVTGVEVRTKRSDEEVIPCNIFNSEEDGIC
ncbi:putative Double-strand break repair protein mus-23 [Glarea lozoyensis 74030]|uniref:Double-strand break repair protein n=1 Tax=Glarea lozoyensis (strain ATCC 74030 / MF5533) TaxID=1104152 RepID=H0ER19_GLAL7|nr:putative Double-strand break repair protein mus-23 [Glarea lozoyensis 74030]